MQSKVEKLKGSKVKIVVTISPEEMVKYFDHAYKHVAPTVNLPGFRAGKAPRTLVESAAGVTRILSDALDLAINENYQKVVIDEKLNPISSPAIKINKYPNYGATVEDVKNELEFEAEFSVLPEITLGDYTKIKIEKPTKEKIKAEDVEKIIDNLRKQKATFTEIDRPAKMGDLAEMNFEGTVKKVKIEAMCSKNHPVVLGEKTLIPGFEEEIVGMKKGDKKTFKIKFPKDYHGKEYAGKEAEFAVEVLNLKEVRLPEVDETFAADFGQKSAAELRKAIEANLELEYVKKFEDEIEQKVIDKIVPLVKADIPAEMIDKEVDRMIMGYEERLQKMGIDFATYLKGMKKTAEDIKKEMRETALKNIKIGLALGKIVEQEKIDHHDELAGKKAIEHLVKMIVK